MRQMSPDEIVATLFEEVEKLKAELEASARYMRAGKHLHDQAIAMGWKDDGEGAYEFICRKHYQQGYDDGYVEGV